MLSSFAPWLILIGILFRLKVHILKCCAWRMDGGASCRADSIPIMVRQEFKRYQDKPFTSRSTNTHALEVKKQLLSCSFLNFLLLFFLKATGACYVDRVGLCSFTAFLEASKLLT